MFESKELIMVEKHIRRILWTVAGLAFSGVVLAQTGSGDNYVPPSTPNLYDESEPLVPAYMRVKKVKSHAYLGLGGSFGSSNSTGGAGSSAVSWNVVGEAGYVKAVSSWTRIDFGLEVFNGRVGNSLNTIDMDFGGLIKVGYGYNLAENLYALLRFGYGIVNGNYSFNGGVKKSTSGGVWQLGMQMIIPTESSVDLLGGIFFNQYSFGDKGTYNSYDARVGLRLRL